MLWWTPPPPFKKHQPILRLVFFAYCRVFTGGGVGSCGLRICAALMEEEPEVPMFERIMGGVMDKLKKKAA